MFDNRHWDVWRPYSPPIPIYVDIDRVLPTDEPPQREVSARVAKYGLDLSGRMPARQRAWHRLTDGRWIASVEVPVETDGQWMFLDFIASAEAVALREESDTMPDRPSNRWGQPKRF
ncbi:hypothetical protein [Nocardia sp. NPDC005366]|uniref:hypothetical protein n=1 Tax=Nocardia sp. NPDC005366 TaxID=3156878 RepID=UPI00339EB1D2